MLRRSALDDELARARGAVPRPQPRDDVPGRVSARRRSRSARASRAGTRCFRARAAATPARTARSRDCEARLPYVAQMGFDVLYLPPIHPIGRERRKGRNNTLAAAAGRRRQPVGDRRARKAATRRSIPQLGTLDDFRRLVASARAHGLEIALDIAFQCAPDHPYVDAHPEWFRQRAGRQRPVRREPAEEIPGHLSRSTSNPSDWQALWQELQSVLRVLDRRGRAHLPRRQSAHQAVRVLGMGDRADQARASRT